MRKELEHLQDRIDWIDTDNLYEAVHRLKEVLGELIKMMDKALPADKSEDI